MDARAALAFVREHGVALVSARGPVPTLTHAIAGEAISGSWWGHPQGKRIFRGAVGSERCARSAGVPAGRKRGARRQPVGERRLVVLVAATRRMDLGYARQPCWRKGG